MHDVIVIGAGLAGLLATWRLRTAGREVLLLEASSSVGGRIDRAGDPPVEVGPSWVWDHERHLHALLAELGIGTFDHHRQGLDSYDDGLRIQRGRLPGSAIPERRILGGTFAIVDALRDRVGPVVLDCPVRHVEAIDGGVRVSTADGEHDGAVVLVACPPALAAHRITWPDLDQGDVDWLRAVPTWMEDVAKVVVRYPRRFWRDAGLSGRAFSRVGPLMEIHDLSGPDGAPAALFGFLPRPLHTADWRDAVVAQLARLYGDPGRDPIEIHAVAWWAREHTSVERAAAAVDRRIGHPRLREPWLGGRVHWISTETSGFSPGHMDGAVERAEAVHRLLL